MGGSRDGDFPGIAKPSLASAAVEIAKVLRPSRPTVALMSLYASARRVMTFLALFPPRVFMEYFE
jgi:hypothetical protein